MTQCSPPRPAPALTATARPGTRTAHTSTAQPQEMALESVEEKQSPEAVFAARTWAGTAGNTVSQECAFCQKTLLVGFTRQAHAPR